jgi:Anti-sigma-K factor rskA
VSHSATGCPRTHEAVGWALHALEPEEEMDVQQHVPHCSDCRAAARDAEAVMAALGTAVEQIDPPPFLRDSIMSAAAETPQARPAAPAPRPAPEPIPRPAPLRPAEPAPTRPGGSTRPPRAGRTTRRRLVALAAAAVALVAFAGLGVRVTQLQGQRDAEAARAQGLTQLVQQLGKPHALLAADDGTTVAAVVLANGQRQVYTVSLAANAADHVYVLWGVKGSTPEPLGTFDVATADRVMREVGASTQDAYQAYAISLEPGRTMPATPTQVVAKGAYAV